jgi:hypothetical protein
MLIDGYIKIISLMKLVLLMKLKEYVKVKHVMQKLCVRIVYIIKDVGLKVMLRFLLLVDLVVLLVKLQ